MRILGLVCIVSMLAVAGCGNHHAAGHRDGSNELPDGFLTTCATPSDCDDGDPCSTDKCENKVCQHRPVDCQDQDDPCNTGACDPTSPKGACIKNPTNDNGMCADGDGNPGTCSSGFCTPAPQCDVGDYLDCTDPDYKSSDETTDDGSSVIDNYACVQGLTGPEYAYELDAFSNSHIKLTLTATADLDLIVLSSGFCGSTTTCVGTGGLTVGSGNEVVEFDAVAGTTYTVVVDGRNGASGQFHLDMDCVGCKPIKTLACNTTVMGDTTSATATNLISDLDCQNSSGPEEVYTVEVPTGAAFRVTLVSAATEHDLIAFEDEDGTCSEPFCEYSSQNDNPATDVVTLKPQSSDSTTKYSLVVDARTAAGGQYMLQIDCPPQCTAGLGQLDCGSGILTGRTDDPKTTQVIDSYSCPGADMETGPEAIYAFVPNDPGDYTFELTGLDVDLDLIVIEGDGEYFQASCDPAAVCKTQSVATTGTSEKVTFTGDPDKKYYIIVDGKNGAKGNYTLKMTSLACPPPSCFTDANTLSCTYLRDQRSNTDPDKSKAALDTYGCVTGSTLSGKEVIYQLPIDTAGMYTVNLDTTASGLNLIVIKGDDSTCDPTVMTPQCQTSTTSVQITAAADDVYYAIVDAAAGVSGDYKISVASTACGMPKCFDSDQDLSCDSTADRTTFSNNGASGATNDIDTWSCSSSMYTGPEMLHFFQPTKSGTYEVQLSGLKADVDLMIIEAASDGTCDPTAKCAQTPGATPAISANKDPSLGEKVQFVADKNKSYYFVVDGFDGAITDYAILISTCAP